MSTSLPNKGINPTRHDRACPFGRMASALKKTVPTPFCRRDTHSVEESVAQAIYLSALRENLGVEIDSFK